MVAVKAIKLAHKLLAIVPTKKAFGIHFLSLTPGKTSAAVYLYFSISNNMCVLTHPVVSMYNQPERGEGHTHKRSSKGALAPFPVLFNRS